MKMTAFIPEKEMTFDTVGADRQRLLHYCRYLQSPILTLDLSQVSHCDSAGLAFLIEAKRLARAHRKSCHVQGMSKTIHALAQFCGVEKILSTDSL